VSATGPRQIYPGSFYIAHANFGYLLEYQSDILSSLQPGFSAESSRARNLTFADCTGVVAELYLRYDMAAKTC
jgi:hypothetical protein